ncbi:MAG TPA: IclR family transcriptional regulator, partial [Candidatus Omnitrophica bacterium]|nr:IclR family transcriptional regulator [Candidatus Omnitrophota bacterium]
GKVFLAYMPEEKFERIIKERGLKKYTENTITDVDKLKKELKEIRSSGYAFDDQEVRLGVRRIAAPIFDHSNNLAGVVGIAGPTFRIRKGRINELARMVKQTAKDISQELGSE